MEPFICRFYSTRNFKLSAFNTYTEEWKAITKYLDDEYKEMKRDLKILNYASGNDAYYIDKIMNSKRKTDFEYNIASMLISKFNKPFDFLYYSYNTILVENHSVKLISTGNYPYNGWEVEIQSESYEYTLRERMDSNLGIEIVKAEKGNTLVSAYPSETLLKYNTLKYHPNFVNVKVAR